MTKLITRVDLLDSRKRTSPSTFSSRTSSERLLYRLSCSPHPNRFVLKGAMMLTTWLPDTARGTRDLDLLGFGEAHDERLLGIFRDALASAVDDGVAFDPDALQVGPVREGLECGGVRLRGGAWRAYRDCRR